jgi:hypothetical protein
MGLAQGRGGIERHTEEAFQWAESITGGRIVSKRRQARWRPHWFLEIDTGESEPLRVMLRGFRNPGYLNDEKGARASLATEAGVIRSLQDTPVRVPRFYGFNEELSWILMEWVSGTEFLTEIDDETLRHDLFRQYMENIAALHTLDREKLDLPSGLPRPSSERDNVIGKFEAREAMYRRYTGIDPEPLFELGLRWIRDHVPQGERPECPAPRATPRSNAHALLARQLEETFAPAGKDEEERFFLESSGALARHLELGNALGPELDRQDLDELGEVLGRRPSDRMEGLAALERAVAADYERDLERRLRLFHRMEVRKEFLWEPIQRATGFATNHPLTRMNASPSGGDAGRGEERT